MRLCTYWYIMMVLHCVPFMHTGNVNVNIKNMESLVPTGSDPPKF